MRNFWRQFFHVLMAKNNILAPVLKSYIISFFFFLLQIANMNRLVSLAGTVIKVVGSKSISCRLLGPAQYALGSAHFPTGRCFVQSLTRGFGVSGKPDLGN